MTPDRKSNPRPCILFITDDADSYKFLGKFFLQHKYDISYLKKAYSVTQDVIKNTKIVFLDLDEEEFQELFLLKKLKDLDPLMEVIIFSQPVEQESVAEAIRFGAFKIIFRPIEKKEILSALKAIEEKVNLRRETFLLEKELEEKYLFEGMIGKNPKMMEIFSLIERVSKYPISVLITGATGTGKGKLAQCIHALSPRKNKKFVTCDCPTIPENLFESELFGHVRGAFTGAHRTKAGLLEEAHQGTIFFDEIVHLPFFMQSKLLRVLEEHKFRRIGSNEDIEVDIRVIAASNIDFKEAIKKGTFREDLYHRINSVKIVMPELRERQEDIPLLSRHFLNQYNKKFNKNIAGMSNRVKKILVSHDWPGNVRELEKAKEYAVALCSKKFIDTDDLPLYLKELSQDEREERERGPEDFPTLETLEREHIRRALALSLGNKVRAAKMLGISRYSLYRKLNSLKMSKQ